ncbi:unnamed protein product [Cunninghamella echinulata]
MSFDLIRDRFYSILQREDVKEFYNVNQLELEEHPLNLSVEDEREIESIESECLKKGYNCFLYTKGEKGIVKCLGRL